MMSVITFFLSKYWLFLAIAGVALGYIGLKEFEVRSLHHQVAGLTQQLADANAALAVEKAITTELEHNAQHDTHIRTVVQHVIQQIEASPNANTLVPVDIAVAWASGIDGLRDDNWPRSSGDTGQPAGLPRSVTPFY